MEGKSTSSNPSEMTINYWTLNKVKQEFSDESTYSCPNVKEESVLQLDEEIKTEDEYFEAYEEAVLEATCNQISETTFDKYFSPKENLKNDNRNSERMEDVFKEQEGFNSDLESKSLKCITCDRSFNYKRSLKVHMLSVHEKLKPFKCPSCVNSFCRKEHLLTHIKSVHEKLKPYKCPHCDYSFGQKHHLSSHIKSVHEKLRPFKCPRPNCDYSCGHKGSLSRHIKFVHEKLKPFKCATCDYSCSLKHHLSSHIKYIHKI